MNLGKFSITNGVLLNIIMVALLVMGYLSLKGLPKETMSDISFSWGMIVVPYPGVSAEDIEKNITIKLEDELADLDRLKRISSISREGSAFIQVEFDDGISDAEFRRLFQDLRTEVDKVELPEDALDPWIDEFTTDDFMPIITLNISGEMDDIELNQLTRDIRDDLRDIDDISKVDIVGGREQEIWIEVDKNLSESYKVSLQEISDAINRRNINIPAGVVDTKRNKYMVRTVGEVPKREHLGDVIVRSHFGEGSIKVSDVANVSSGLAESDYDVRYNGKKAISLFISKKKSGNAIDLVNEIKKRSAFYEKKYKGKVSFEYSGDTTYYIRDTIKTLSRNSLSGIILLVLTLFLFLGVRNSLITALGIPMTFAISFLFMEWYGESLNANSMFALVLVLGMIVDHAIVLIENIYRHRQNGLGRHEAAIVGTNEVVKPVIAATATTIAAFLPLMLLPGIMGKFLRIIPIVVSLALVASTLEALFFIPLHFAEWGSKAKDDHHLFKRFQAFFRGVVGRLYKHRYLTFIVTLLIIIFSIGMATKEVNVALFEGEELSQFTINIELPRSASRSETDKVVKRYEERVLPLIGTKEFLSVGSTVGFLRLQDDWKTEDNTGQITVYLKELAEGRTRSVSAIMEEVQELCKDIPGAEKVVFDLIEDGPPVDKPISFRVLGKDLDQMEKLSAHFQKRLAEYKELYNIGDNYQKAAAELVIRVDEQKASELGLSVAQIGFYLRQAIDGIKATTFFDNDEEIDVIVKFNEKSKQSMKEIAEIQFPTMDGRLIPFSVVATIEPTTGLSKILRYKRKRAITISADATSRSRIQTITKTLEEEFNTTLKEQYPGVIIDMAGEFAEFNKVLEDVVRLLWVGVFLLFIILGAQFKSYVQPLIMMFTVPFALVGVLWFMIVSGTSFSITVMYALVALVGISVNDSIVLISFINHRRRVEGMKTAEAVIDGATTRLRPIILTSVTTMGGLIPLAIGIGGKSPTWAPMASTIVFGLFFSTVGTLIVIPSIYGIVDDVMSFLGFKMKLEGE